MVAVPVSSGVAACRGRTVRARAADYRSNLGRVRGFLVTPRLILVQLSEAPADCDMLLARHRPAAKEQHAVLDKSAIDCAESGVVERLADVDSHDFRAQGVREFAYRQTHFLVPLLFQPLATNNKGRYPRPLLFVHP